MNFVIHRERGRKPPDTSAATVENLSNPVHSLPENQSY
jgi:hypothetical protein